MSFFNFYKAFFSHKIEIKKKAKNGLYQSQNFYLPLKSLAKQKKDLTRNLIKCFILARK